MPYIGRGLGPQGAFRILDDISGSFNGSTVTFALTVASAALTVGLPETLIIAVDGVIQEPGSAYTISGSNIVFGAAPQDAATFWGVEIGDVGTQILSTDATEADKDDMEAEATGVLYAPPDLVKHSPGVAKAWCQIAADGTILGSTSYPNSYNIDAIAAVSTGNRTVSWDVPFSTVNYSVSSTEIAVGNHTINTHTLAVGSMSVNPRDSSNNNTDAGTCHIAFGDQ